MLGGGGSSSSALNSNSSTYIYLGSLKSDLPCIAWEKGNLEMALKRF